MEYLQYINWDFVAVWLIAGGIGVFLLYSAYMWDTYGDGAVYLGEAIVIPIIGTLLGPVTVITALWIYICIIIKRWNTRIF